MIKVMWHCAALIRSDFYRITGSFRVASLIKHVLFSGGPYKYLFWHRLAACFMRERMGRYFIYPWVRLIHNHYKYKFGISIPLNTQIGSGFFISHWGGIVVNQKSIIGKNCNISQGVTIGQSNRGKNKGYPIIGDNVYIGPGAIIIGAVTVGNNAAIGANCVVTKSVPDNGVAVGVPGRVISLDGSFGYVNRADYD